MQDAFDLTHLKDAPAIAVLGAMSYFFVRALVGVVREHREEIKARDDAHAKAIAARDDEHAHRLEDIVRRYEEAAAQQRAFVDRLLDRLTQSGPPPPRQ